MSFKEEDGKGDGTRRWTWRLKIRGRRREEKSDGDANEGSEVVRIDEWLLQFVHLFHSDVLILKVSSWVCLVHIFKNHSNLEYLFLCINRYLYWLTKNNYKYTLNKKWREGGEEAEQKGENMNEVECLLFLLPALASIGSLQSQHTLLLSLSLSFFLHTSLFLSNTENHLKPWSIDGNSILPFKYSKLGWYKCSECWVKNKIKGRVNGVVKSTGVIESSVVVVQVIQWLVQNLQRLFFLLILIHSLNYK